MKPLKILFATIPFDGHFNPLIGLALHLKNEGHDVRWYTQQVYNDKLQRMDIPLYPFKRVVQYNQYNLDEIFSDRLKFKGQIKRLNFDLQYAFIRRAPEFFEDIQEIDKNFPFDVLVTQGTIEKDPEKLIVPTIEAFKNTDTFVIVTTGGSKTEELQQRFKYKNVLIEGFIPFEEVLSFTDVFVTNGGYGGVMLSIEHEVPLVGAGIHEGKNEINARIGYFKLGINLKTETPSPALILKSVNEIISNGTYKQNVKKLGEEFRKYDAFDLSTRYILATTGQKAVTHESSLQHQE